MLNLDTISKGYFQKTADGRTLFYPWGALGPGYVVPTDAVRERLERLTTRGVLAMAAAAVIPFALDRKALGVLVLVVAFLLYSAWARCYLTRGLERASERMELKRALADQADRIGPVAIWLMLLFFLAITAAGAFIVTVEPAEWPMALACIAMFGPLSVYLAWLLWIRASRA